MAVVADTPKMRAQRWPIVPAVKLLLVVFAIIGVGVTMTGLALNDKHLLRIGLLICTPMAAAATMLLLAALPVLLVLSFKGRARDQENAIDLADVDCWDLEEAVRRRLPRAEGPLPLEESTSSTGISNSATSGLSPGRWRQMLQAFLESMPAEIRLSHEWLSNRAFLLELPGSRDHWRKCEWLHECGPVMVRDDDMEYVILDLGRLQKDGQGPLLRFLLNLQAEDSGTVADRVCLTNLRREYQPTVKQFAAKFQIVTRKRINQMRMAH